MAQSQRDKAQRRLRDDLVPDEEVRHAVLAFQIGGARQDIAAGGGAIAGSVGQVLGVAVSPSAPGAAHAPELEMPHRCFIALTTHRLLVLTLGGVFVAAPEGIVHAVPLDHIAWMAEPDTDGSLARTMRITLGLTSGVLLRWEFPRLQISRGSDLIDDLRQHLTDR